MPKISIIVPVYNAADLLSSCVGSILRTAENAEMPWELILVDDGSTDGSGRICEERASEHDRITVLHKENGGAASARNAGLKAAAGDYIAWVDADDEVTGSWYSRIEKVIAEHQPDVLMFDMQMVSETETCTETYGRPAGFVDRDTVLSDIARDIRIKSGLPNKVIKRKLFENCAFCEDNTILEDYDKLPDILLRAATFFYIPEALYRYRQKSGSLIHSHSPEQTLQGIEISRRRMERFPEKYRAAAMCGLAVQLLWFCRAQAYDGRYRKYRKEYRDCRRALWKALPQLMRDGEVPLRFKEKVVLAAAGVLPLFVAMKGKQS